MVTTEWRYPSHAWHMGERFLVGYPVEGRWHRSPVKLVFYLCGPAAGQ